MILGGRISGRAALNMVLGGIIGYAFYHYVGCANGTCIITGNPYVSTLYGIYMGWLISETKA